MHFAAGFCSILNVSSAVCEIMKWPRIFLVKRNPVSSAESCREDFNVYINLCNIIKCHNFSCF